MGMVEVWCLQVHPWIADFFSKDNSYMQTHTLKKLFFKCSSLKVLVIWARTVNTWCFKPFFKNIIGMDKVWCQQVHPLTVGVFSEGPGYMQPKMCTFMNA